MTRSSCVPHSGAGDARGLRGCVSQLRAYTEKQTRQPPGLAVLRALESIRRRTASLGQLQRQHRSQLFPIRKNKVPGSRALYVAIAWAGPKLFTPGKKFCTRLTDLRGPPSIARWSSFETGRVLTKVRRTNCEGGMQADSLPKPSPINTAKGHRLNRSPAV